MIVLVCLSKRKRPNLLKMERDVYITVCLTAASFLTES